MIVHWGRRRRATKKNDAWALIAATCTTEKTSENCKLVKETLNYVPSELLTLLFLRLLFCLLVFLAYWKIELNEMSACWWRHLQFTAFSNQLTSPRHLAGLHTRIHPRIPPRPVYFVLWTSNIFVPPLSLLLFLLCLHWVGLYYIVFEREGEIESV